MNHLKNQTDNFFRVNEAVITKALEAAGFAASVVVFSRFAAGRQLLVVIFNAIKNNPFIVMQVMRMVSSHLSKPKALTSIPIDGVCLVKVAPGTTVPEPAFQALVKAAEANALSSEKFPLKEGKEPISYVSFLAKNLATGFDELLDVTSFSDGNLEEIKTLLQAGLLFGLPNLNPLLKKLEGIFSFNPLRGLF